MQFQDTDRSLVIHDSSHHNIATQHSIPTQNYIIYKAGFEGSVLSEEKSKHRLKLFGLTSITHATNCLKPPTQHPSTVRTLINPLCTVNILTLCL